MSLVLVARSSTFAIRKRRQRRRRSSDGFLNHVAGHIGQAFVATVMTVGQPSVIEAHQMKNRGVYVVRMGAFLDGA